MLVKYIEEPQNNEQSRIEACFALSWVATDDQMKDVVKKVHEFNKPDPKAQLIRGCYLETLVHRPVPGGDRGPRRLSITADLDRGRGTRRRAPSASAASHPIQPQLFEKLKDASAATTRRSRSSSAPTPTPPAARSRRTTTASPRRSRSSRTSTTDLRLLERQRTTRTATSRAGSTTPRRCAREGARRAPGLAAS